MRARVQRRLSPLNCQAGAICNRNNRYNLLVIHQCYILLLAFAPPLAAAACWCSTNRQASDTTLIPALASASSNASLVMPDCSHTAAGFAASMSSRCGGKSEGFLNTSTMSMGPAQGVTAGACDVAVRMQIGADICFHSTLCVTGGVLKHFTGRAQQRCNQAHTHLARPGPCDRPAGRGCGSRQDKRLALARPPRPLTAGTVARRMLAGRPVQGG